MILTVQGDDLTAHITRDLPALPTSYVAEKPRAIAEEEKEFEAFKTLRVARADQRNEGARKKRAEAKASEEAAKKVSILWICWSLLTSVSKQSCLVFVGADLAWVEPSVHWSCTIDHPFALCL
jgi:hypothetical protein